MTQYLRQLPARPLVSLVVPMYNEEAVVDIFFNTIVPVLEQMDIDYEFICVNDGSSDRTVERLSANKKNFPTIKIIEFSRNFGKEAALTAGLAAANGHVVIPIDIDLQDPPTLIPEMIEKWREGFDMVLAVRDQRKSDSLLKRLTAHGFYKLFNAISDHSIVPHAGDFRLLDQSVVKRILELPEKTRFMKGIYNWVTNNYAIIYHERPERVAGNTKWGLYRLWRFSLDGITSFSSVPLKIWSYIGVIISACSIGYMLILIIMTLWFGESVRGYPSLMVAILFLGGVQLISLGVVGEYIARIFTEVKNRPLYIIKNIDD